MHYMHRLQIFQVLFVYSPCFVVAIFDIMSASAACTACSFFQVWFVNSPCFVVECHFLFKYLWKHVFSIWLNFQSLNIRLYASYKKKARGLNVRLRAYYTILSFLTFSYWMLKFLISKTVRTQKVWTFPSNQK